MNSSRKRLTKLKDIFSFYDIESWTFDLSNVDIEIVLDFERIDQLSYDLLRKDGHFTEARPQNKFRNNFLFKNTIFKKKVNFSEIRFIQEANFEGSVFQNDASFYKCEFKENAIFRKVEFRGITTFKEAVFHKYGSFSDSIIGKINFQKTIFHDYASFRQSCFTAKARFNLTEFMGSAYFQDMSEKNTGHILFQDAIFTKKVIFRNSSFNELKIAYSSFESTCDFSNADINIFNIQSGIFKETGLFHEASIKVANRETLRSVKHEFKKLDNQFEALVYQKREKEAYHAELKEKPWYDENKAILFLNKISNQHGLSPLTGIIFTLSVVIIFYVPNLFLLKDSFWQFGWNGWQEFFEVFGISIKLLMKSLYAAHSFDYLKEYNPKAITFVFDMVGRIFLTYGYYQTVSAFRKFSKQ